MRKRKRKPSLQTIQVLSRFLQKPKDLHYGSQLMKETGLTPGSLYPILSSLEDKGWVKGKREDVDPKLVQRPARKYYQITKSGFRQGEVLVKHVKSLI